MDSIRQATDRLIQYLLVHVKSPEKLREVEVESPQICVENGEIWLKFIKRDVPGWEKKKHRPEDPIAPDDWYELYWSLRAESRREIEADEKIIATEMLRLKHESEKHRSRHVHPSEVPPLPKMGAMKLIKTPKKKKMSSSLIATKPDKLILSVGSKAKVRSGGEFLKKARCQVKEHHSFFGPNSNLSRPTHTLAAQSTQINTAPRSIVYDYRNPAWKPHDSSIKPPEVFLPKRKQVEPDESFTSGKSTTAENKSSVRVVTSPVKNITTSSESCGEQPRVVAQKRKRAESNEFSAQDQSVEKKRRLQAMSKTTNTAPTSLRTRPPSVDQSRNIEPKRKRFECDGSSRPEPSAGEKGRPQAFGKATPASTSSRAIPPPIRDQPRITAPKRRRVESVESSIPDQVTTIEKEPRRSQKERHAETFRACQNLGKSYRC